MSFITENDSTAKRSVQPPQIQARTISKSLFLASAFMEGFVKYSFDAHVYFFFQTILDMPPQTALQSYHLQCSMFFFCISLSPVVIVLKKPRRTYWTMLVFASLSLIGFTFLILLSYPFENIFSNRRKRHIVVSMTAFTSAAYGGKWFWTRRTIYEQHRFPKELDEYVRSLLANVFTMNVGRVIGMIVTNYVSRNGQTINHVFFFSALVGASLLELFILLFGLLMARKGFPSQPTAGDMIRNEVNMFFRRRNRPENSVIRTIASLLPLYVPVLFLQGYRHQKFSRFVRQAEMLDLESAQKNYKFHPTFLNIVQPVVLVIFIYPFQFLLDFLGRHGIPYRTPTRTLCAFTFVALALLSGSLVQVFIEDRADESIKIEHGCVVVYNTLECPAFVKTKLLSTVTLNPMSHIMLTSTTHINILDENEQSMEIVVRCGATKYTTGIKLSVEQMQISEYILRPVTDSKNIWNLSGVQLNQLSPRIIKSTFFFANTVRLVYSTPFNMTIGGQLTKYYSEKQEPGYANEVEIFPTGRYHVTINGLLLHELKISKGTSLTILVSRSLKKQLQAVPLSRIIVILPPNVVAYYYHIPQLFLQGLADLMMDTPGFIYASNLAASEMHEALQLMWFLTQAVANLWVASAVFEFHSSVYNYLLGFSVSVWSTIFFAKISKHFYKTDYEMPPARQPDRKPEDKKKSS